MASLTLLGEIHGTREAPAELLALAGESGFRRPVRLGLELETSEAQRVAAFLRDGDRAQLLAGAFWTRDFQDGRSSQAMAALLDEIRTLRAGGADLDVFLFDEPDDGRTRDRAMADHVSRAVEATPEGRVIVLAGNLHPRTVPGFARDPAYEWMGVVLARRHPLTALELTYREGTAWFCTAADENGRIQTLRSPPSADHGDQRRTIIYPRADERGYHGEIYLPVVSASPPAVGSPRAPSPATPA